MEDKTTVLEEGCNCVDGKCSCDRSQNCSCGCKKGENCSCSMGKDGKCRCGGGKGGLCGNCNSTMRCLKKLIGLLILAGLLRWIRSMFGNTNIDNNEVIIDDIDIVDQVNEVDVPDVVVDGDEVAN